MKQKHELRADLKFIANLVTSGSRILDIGCSGGELLEHLARSKHADARGVEIEQHNVSLCVKSGLAVIQGDVDTDLKFYPDQCFDYVISSQMLQATRYPKLVLEETLRIGKKVIISIPNFGYWYNRLHLAIYGKMPVSKSLPYAWYDTPNIHFCTINDFENLCRLIGAKIEQSYFLAPCGSKDLSLLANFRAETGVFVLSKNGAA